LALIDKNPGLLLAFFAFSRIAALFAFDGVAWITVLVALLRYPVDWPGLALRKIGETVSALEIHSP